MRIVNLFLTTNEPSDQAINFGPAAFRVQQFFVSQIYLPFWAQAANIGERLFALKRQESSKREHRITRGRDG